MTLLSLGPIWFLGTCYPALGQLNSSIDLIGVGENERTRETYVKLGHARLN